MTASLQSQWTVPEIIMLKKLWAEGHSASLIAKRMGRVSRSAVIGKVHRLGLQRMAYVPRARDESLEPPVKPWRSQRHVFGGKTEPTPPAQDDPPSQTPQTILRRRDDGSLEANDAMSASCCRWPIGDPRSPEFHFCGASAALGLPYCQGHAVRAYRAAEPSTRSPYVQRKGGAAVFDRGHRTRVLA